MSPSGHAILAVRAIKGIMKDDIASCIKRQICDNIKIAFFLKLSYSKVRAFFTYLGRGGHFAKIRSSQNDVKFVCS